MDIFAIGVCAACAAVFGALIKRGNKEYALLLSAAACTVILLSVVGNLEPVVSQLETLVGLEGVSDSVFPIVLKAVGIAVAGQLASHVCKDAGESALSYAVDLAAKSAIFVVSLPLLTKVFEYLEEIVKL